MDHSVLIIGAGMGGLAAALRLRQRGIDVRVMEMRHETGGLASGLETGGHLFDAGPYILLDRPGLDWAFHSLELELQDHVALRPIEHVYEVQYKDGPALNFYGDLKKTSERLEQTWPGSGKRYESFVASMTRAHQQLSPMLHISRPGFMDLVRSRALNLVPFLLGSLGSTLSGPGLPQPVIDSIAIWTHIAGQKIDAAPSPMAFVPALIHGVGAYYPVGGVATIPGSLTDIASKAGVEFLFGTKVRRIVCDRGRVCGVETEADEFFAADSVISNHSAIGTYINMLRETPERSSKRLRKLSLQSPGACAYLAIRGKMDGPYLRFFVPGDGDLCRVLVRPGVLAPELEKDGWFPARLIAPMRYELAEQLSLEQQREYLDRLLAETWWRSDVDEFRVLTTRVPAEWGTQYNLYRNSMNPVMTARFMRAGRIAHRSPYVRGLYLAGSSTHPGQWVSFCAISGILAADDLFGDIR